VQSARTRSQSRRDLSYPRTFLVTDDRWQYIGSGLKDEILGDMVTEAQMKRISAALAPILN
jgi:hypothetical protein